MWSLEGIRKYGFDEFVRVKILYLDDATSLAGLAAVN